MQQALQSLEQPLPLGTAVLSHVALALLMWNIAFRLAALLFAGWTMVSS